MEQRAGFMTALNVTQRTEDEFITQKEQNRETGVRKKSRREEEDEDEDVLSYWRANVVIFSFSS